MSVLSNMIVETAIQHAIVGVHPLAQGIGDQGLIEWAQSKNAAVQGLSRGVAITVGIVFVIVQAIISRLALARIVVSGIVAGLLIWIVFNVTDLRDASDRELNGAGRPQSSTSLLVTAAAPGV